MTKYVDIAFSDLVFSKDVSFVRLYWDTFGETKMINTNCICYKSPRGSKDKTTLFLFRPFLTKKILNRVKPSRDTVNFVEENTG